MKISQVYTALDDDGQWFKFGFCDSKNQNKQILLTNEVFIKLIDLTWTEYVGHTDKHN